MMTFMILLLNFVTADQVCIRTKKKSQHFPYGHHMQPFSGTDCALKMTAYLNNGQKRVAFIDKNAPNSGNQADGWVAIQRVHEHTDSCFELHVGGGQVDLSRSIKIEFVDKSCDDAMWVDQFFVPHRASWGIQNAKGWCMNSKRFIDDGSQKFYNGWNTFTYGSYHSGCAHTLWLKPGGHVSVIYGADNARGHYGSGRRQLTHVKQTVEETNDDSEMKEIKLIESLYDICEQHQKRLSVQTRFDSEIEEIVQRCFKMLESFDDTYDAYRQKQLDDIPEQYRYESSTMEEVDSDFDEEATQKEKQQSASRSERLSLEEINKSLRKVLNAVGAN
jgi:Skp family chaperone for outer membrane proteins